MTEKKIPTAVDSFEKTVIQARDGIVNRLGWLYETRGVPTNPSQLGFFAELALCVRHNLTPWYNLPKTLREDINGGVSSRDLHTDGVGEKGVYAQIKWKKIGKTIPVDTAIKLFYWTNPLKAAGVIPVTKRVIIVQNGTRVSRELLPADDRANLEIIDCDTLAMIVETAEIAAKCLRESQLGANEILSRAHPGDILLCKSLFEPLLAGQAWPQKYDEIHAECVELLWAAYKNNTKNQYISAQLPTGSGKSFIISILANKHKDEHKDLPVIVMAPRRCIVRQLEMLLKQQCTKYTTCVVGDGSAWVAGRDIYIVSCQSADKIPDGTEVSAIIRDEGHIATGRKTAEDQTVPKTRPIYRLSATFRNIRLNYNLDVTRAIEMGLICDFRYVFAAFEEPPNHCDMAAHLVEHPEFQCILACFQTQTAAINFAKMYNTLDSGQARAHVTSECKMSDVEDFRQGNIRVLAIVTKLAMGINIPRIDAVLLAEPWKSPELTRQLCGRGSRWHPGKPGYCSILQCITADREQSKLHTLSEMIISNSCSDEAIRRALENVEVVHGINLAQHQDRDKARRGIAVETKKPHSETDAAEVKFLTAVRHTVYNRLRQEIKSPATRLRVQFEHERRILMRAKVTPSGYAAWRKKQTGLAPHDFPEIPATYYGSMFSWDSYLGIEIVDLASLRKSITAGLIAIFEEDPTAREDWGVTGSEEEYQEWYNRLLARDASLPTNPLNKSSSEPLLKYAPDWTTLFKVSV